MAEKREPGIKNAEPEGKIKTMILTQIYNSDNLLSSEEIIANVKRISRNVLKKKISENKGIYRHLQQLQETSKEKNGLGLIEKERKGQENYYKPLPNTLDNFRELCRYIVKHDSFQIFMDTGYFKERLAEYFRDLVKEGFDINIPTLHKTDFEISKFTQLLLLSPLATKLLILEPDKLYALKPIVSYNPRLSVKDDEIKKQAKERVKRRNLSLKESEEELKTIFALVEKVMPFIGVCLRYEINEEIITHGAYTERYRSLIEKDNRYKDATNFITNCIYAVKDDEPSEIYDEFTGQSF